MLNTAANRFRQSPDTFPKARFSGVARRSAVTALQLCAVAVFSAATLSSCGNYDPLPPKTEASTSYYIPEPEAPTQAEIDGMKAERAEYNKLTAK